jgi:phage shock protein PspC (stress-responsive transcriptional regulator)
MKKVINASVGGRSFALDEDAYNRLSVYFDHFKARLNRDSQAARDEVMSDLESRIAELFDEGIGGASYRVIDFTLVSKVVGQLGMPDGSAEPFGPSTGTSSSAGSGPSTSSGTGTGPDFSYSGDKGEAKKRLFRDPDNKAIGGVCAGVASFLNIDITIVRIILLLALLLWGTGLLVYLVLWIVVPLAKTPADKCEMRGLEPTAENMAKFSDYYKK